MGEVEELIQSLQEEVANISATLKDNLLQVVILNKNRTIPDMAVVLSSNKKQPVKLHLFSVQFINILVMVQLQLFNS